MSYMGFNNRHRHQNTRRASAPQFVATISSRPTSSSTSNGPSAATTERSSECSQATQACPTCETARDGSSCSSTQGKQSVNIAAASKSVSFEATSTAAASLKSTLVLDSKPSPRLSFSPNNITGAAKPPSTARPLSVGVIVGISVSSALLLLCICSLCVYFFWLRKRYLKNPAAFDPSNRNSSAAGFLTAKGSPDLSSDTSSFHDGLTPRVHVLSALSNPYQEYDPTRLSPARLSSRLSYRVPSRASSTPPLIALSPVQQRGSRHLSRLSYASHLHSHSHESQPPASPSRSPQPLPKSIFSSPLPSPPLSARHSTYTASASASASASATPYTSTPYTSSPQISPTASVFPMPPQSQHPPFPFPFRNSIPQALAPFNTSILPFNRDSYAESYLESPIDGTSPFRLKRGDSRKTLQTIRTLGSFRSRKGSAPTPQAVTAGSGSQRASTRVYHDTTEKDGAMLERVASIRSVQSQRARIVNMEREGEGRDSEGRSPLSEFEYAVEEGEEGDGDGDAFEYDAVEYLGRRY